jgi:acetyltransferase-like isoleucine patch superfamily enzyme
MNQYVNPYDTRRYGKIGNYSIVKNNSCLVPKNIYIDDYVIIQDQTNFISNKGKLKVGKYSVISAGCNIIPGAHRLTVGVPFYLSTLNHFNDEDGEIVIEEDCWIGSGCILLPNCHIGRGAVVGAGSVVKKAVPPYAVVVGSPARIIASKFTIDEILKHESILYPPEERMSESQLQELFDMYYHGLKSIGSDILKKEDLDELDRIKNSIGMKNYSIDNYEI